MRQSETKSPSVNHCSGPNRTSASFYTQFDLVLPPHQTNFPFKSSAVLLKLKLKRIIAKWSVAFTKFVGSYSVGEFKNANYQFKFGINKFITHARLS